MEIHGFNKLTLLDYPETTACTIFTGGCNFRCPFCHNRSLVLAPDSQPLIPEEEVLSYLKKRIGILDGVCVTGGEPTVQPDLYDFFKKVKALGFKLKLDTNGTRPDVVKRLVEDGLCDYVAMDIKNSKEGYGKSVGIENFNTEKIEETAKYLLEGHVEYEFRTTVVDELNSVEDFKSIGKWLSGADKYFFLQTFRDSGDLINDTLHAKNDEKMREILEILRPFFKKIEIR